MTIELAQNT